jgi:hypothetical protein
VAEPFRFAPVLVAGDVWQLSAAENGRTRQLFDNAQIPPI